jgi:hypothetical protein
MVDLDRQIRARIATSTRIEGDGIQFTEALDALEAVLQTLERIDEEAGAEPRSCHAIRMAIALELGIEPPATC